MTALFLLPRYKIEDADRAAKTILEYSEYTAPDGILVLLADSLRRDICDFLELEPVTRRHRSRYFWPLAELTDERLHELDQAAETLLDIFAAGSDDPALLPYLREFRASLEVHAAERKLHAEPAVTR
jgi:hypothetical protein